MLCKILFNFFNEDEDTQYTDFWLDLNSVNGFYILEVNGYTTIVVIVNGTEYCLHYEEKVHSRIKLSIESREKYNLN